MAETNILRSSILAVTIAILSGCQSTRIWPVGLSREVQGERQFSLVSAGGSITAIGTQSSLCQIYAYTHFVPKDVHKHVGKSAKEDLQDIENTFKLESDGDKMTLEVGEPSERISIRKVDYVIMLPHQMHLNLHTARGDLKLIKISGDVRATTEKGEAVIYQLQGNTYISDGRGSLASTG